MIRNILALLIMVLMSQPGWSAAPASADDPSEMLARAEALYYEAEFAKSVELLTRADEILRPQAGHLEEKINVKMQLALAFMGLNDISRAKTNLVELYALDSDHRMDPQVFAPKVVKLAEEAKAEQDEVRCQSILNDAQKQYAAGNSENLVKTIGAGKTKCPGVSALSSKAADLVFKEGLENYKKSQMTDALQKFRTALALDPGHDLAAQYVDLTERKLEFTADRALLAWRKDFDAGEFALASSDYRELASLKNANEIESIQAEYRRAMSSSLESWNRSCAADDVPAMEKIRSQAASMVPFPSFGEDILAKMKNCVPVGCLQMESQSALTRLKSRVDPQFPAQVISRLKGLPMTVHVKARIDVNGNVVSNEIRGGDIILYSAVRTAVDQWKFLPAVTGSGARCVDTDIPITIHLAN
jgi:thioredoxin-like negative regulator of GroEL